MNHLADWIRRHQIIAFFVITFAITWGLGFSYDAVINKGADLLAPLVFIATCGPALAGIIVSAVCNDQPRQGKNEQPGWRTLSPGLYLHSSALPTSHSSTIAHFPPYSLPSYSSWWCQLHL